MQQRHLPAVSGLFCPMVILKLNLFHNNHPDSAHSPGTGRTYESQIKGCLVDESILPPSSALPPPHPGVAFV